MELKPKNINIFTAIILFTYRFIVVVGGHNYSRDSWINLSIPIIFFILVCFNNKKIDSAFYTIVAVCLNMFGNYANLLGAFFFFIAIYDNKEKVNICINSGLFLITLSLKQYFFVVDEGETSTIAYALGFIYVFLHLYSRFWSIADTAEKHCVNKGLTPEQIATIDMLLKGLTHKESADILNIERKTYTARVSSLRKRFNAKSDFLLAIALMKEGYVSLNTLANAKIDNKTLNKERI